MLLDDTLEYRSPEQLLTTCMCVCLIHSPQAASMLLDDILASHLPTSRAPRLHAILLQPGALCRPCWAGQLSGTFIAAVRSRVPARSAL